MGRVSDRSGYRPMWLMPVQYERITRAVGNAHIYNIDREIYLITGNLPSRRYKR